MTAEVLLTAPAAASAADWRDGELRAPESERPLVRDTPHSLTDGVRRFPLVDGIPYLRSNRDALRAETLAHLDAGRTEQALALLLADRDDWARGDGAREEDLRTLIRNEPDLTLRDAMYLLAFGPVADYFAYRWSDPTFLSGLKLLEIGLPTNTSHVVEIACGIGHYLRELTLRGIAATGVDVVFSKLWLARKFVSPDARLVCADVASGLPFENDFADTVFCHDAFYFLPEKRKVADEMLRVSSGPILIGHAHNRDAENFSSGEPWSADEYAALLPDAVVYDDEELTRAFVGDREPRAAKADDVRRCAALSFVGRVATPTLDTRSSPDAADPEGPADVNPLFCAQDGTLQTTPAWPSERYEAEYALLSDYLSLARFEASELEAWKELSSADRAGHPRYADWLRRRIILQLPSRW